MNRREFEILQRYQQGERNLQGADLRGLSFEGDDFSDADFSFADIRGTNFRGANLTEAKFCGAKAGLQKRQVVVLFAGVFVLLGISAILNLLISAVISSIFNQSDLDYRIAGWVSLIVVIIFWITFIHKGIENSVVVLAFAAAVAFAGVVGFSIGGIFLGTLGFRLAGTVAIAETVALAGSIAIAGSVAIAGSADVAVAVAYAIALAYAIVLAYAIALGHTLTFTLALHVAVATFQTPLTGYVAYRAIKGDEKYALIRNIAIVFAAIGGTSFRDANLTDADFTNATLKSTDFRGANIIRTCWRNTIQLDRIRPGETYLKDTKVRELVRTGQGENQDFNRFNLQGVNLQQASLTNASFIEANLNSANLQDANLSRAKLVGTFLDQANFTEATLTGSFIENWGITTKTKLDGIKCDYVYMRLPPDKRPEFLKLPPKDTLNDNSRREPANWNKNFKEGEFVDFITPMVETLNFYHAEKVDPRIVAYSFQKLQEPAFLTN